MPSYPYSYVYYTSPLYSVVLPVLATIVALAGGLALYFLFVRRPTAIMAQPPGCTMHSPSARSTPSACSARCIASRL